MYVMPGRFILVESVSPELQGLTKRPKPDAKFENATLIFEFYKSIQLFNKQDLNP